MMYITHVIKHYAEVFIFHLNEIMTVMFIYVVIQKSVLMYIMRTSPCTISLTYQYLYEMQMLLFAL